MTASTFSTVGEAILIPILDEFKLMRTKFGQMILGVGTIDDIIELVTIIIVSVLLGYTVEGSDISISGDILILSIMFLVPLLLYVFHSKIHPLKFKKIPPMFLFGLVVLFAFIGIGSYVESSALGAILAGIALKNLLSEEKIAQFESIIRIFAYGFLVPIFFLHVGMEIDVRYLFTAPLLILTILIITSVTKIIISYLFGRTRIGANKSIILGIALSAKFSTSIVIIAMLYKNNIIPSELYSVLIGAMIASEFIIPVTFSVLLKKWDLKFKHIGKNYVQK